MADKYPRQNNRMRNYFEIFRNIAESLIYDRVPIDNWICKLHYRFTVAFLFGSSVFLTCSHYLDEVLDCGSAVMNNICWVQSTFTITRSEGNCGPDAIHTGVSMHHDSQDQIQYHPFYRWVSIALFLQSVFFSVPRYLWSFWEGRRMESLVGNLRGKAICEDQASLYARKNLATYIVKTFNSKRCYEHLFLFTEVLYIVNVGMQILILNWCFDGAFFSFGIDYFMYMKYGDETTCDPMHMIFPKFGKCVTSSYSSSGTIETFDALCMMPFNTVHEKIFLIEWLWFMTLVIVTGSDFACRFVTFILTKLRRYILKSRLPLLSSEQVKTLIRSCDSEDLFLFEQLRMNLHSVVFNDVLIEAANKLEESSNDPSVVEEVEAQL